MSRIAERAGLAGVARVAPVTPYVAVLIGLHLFSSAWAAILLYHAGIVLVVSATRGWRLGLLPRTRPARLALTAFVLGAALVGPFIYGLWSTLRRDGLDLSAELGDLGLTGVVWAGFVVYYFTVNPVLEEVFWRGSLGSAMVGPTWNDGWFAGYHVLVLIKFVEAPWVVLGFLGLTLAALVWRQLVRIFGGLAIPIASHAVADASLILAVALLV